MDPALALQALAEAVDADETALTVMDVDWSQMAGVPGMSDLPMCRSSATCRRSRGCRRSAEAAAGPLGDGVRAEGKLERRLLGMPRRSSRTGCWPTWSGPRPPPSSDTPPPTRSTPAGPSGTWASTR